MISSLFQVLFGFWGCGGIGSIAFLLQPFGQVFELLLSLSFPCTTASTFVVSSLSAGGLPSFQSCHKFSISINYLSKPD
ncbi:hypothetical protein [Egbenema bharatensis]|uniref:hypothetical protein n=1 Tax=Egbenema bharatensis TaxID=3463334 RepID=UPI003A889647